MSFDSGVAKAWIKHDGTDIIRKVYCTVNLGFHVMIKRFIDWPDSLKKPHFVGYTEVLWIKVAVGITKCCAI